MTAAPPVTARTVPIRRVTRETHDTVTLSLDGVGPFVPGQFNMVYLFGIGEVAISISGDPEQTEELVHTVRSVGAVTTPMGALRRGTMLGIRGPFGHGWPLDVAEGKDVLVVAGGLGLAPLRPAIYHLLRHRDRYRSVAVLVGARTPEDLIYQRELERWKRGIDVQVTVDRAGPDWSGDVGVVLALLDRVKFDPAQAVAMVCGPEVMMRAAMRDLVARGIAPPRIYLSMERNMKCGVGHCGHCQYGPFFICKDGPVFGYDRLAFLLDKREI